MRNTSPWHRRREEGCGTPGGSPPPFAPHLRDSLNPLCGSPAERAVAQVLHDTPHTPRKVLMRAAEAALYSDWVAPAITARWSRMGIDIEFAQIEHFRECIVRLPEAVAPMATRFLLNGWTTSDRMHDRVRDDCLLGCAGAPDSLKHYISCTGLRGLLEISSSPEEMPLSQCLGLCTREASPPAKVAVRRLVCATALYQAMRDERRKMGEASPGRLGDIAARACALQMEELDRMQIFSTLSDAVPPLRKFGPPLPPGGSARDRRQGAVSRGRLVPSTT